MSELLSYCYYSIELNAERCTCTYYRNRSSTHPSVIGNKMFAIYLRSKVPAEVSLAKGSLISMVVLIERFQGKEEVYNTKVY